MLLEVIHAAPAQMLLPERLMLYALVYGLRPQRALEVGTAEGGAAMIMCAAMDAANCGQLICVDPEPKVTPETSARLAHRVTLIQKPSPEAISQAYQVADGHFDFAFIDGDHSYTGVLRDIHAVTPCMRDGGYLLFHDVHYVEVREAIDEALQQFPFVDCGLLSVECTPTKEMHRGELIVWGGLRLLRVFPSKPQQQSQTGRDLQSLTGSEPVASRLRRRLQAVYRWCSIHLLPTSDCSNCLPPQSFRM
jgi:predicted O-methyltransferase YrrM